jgi:peptide/nickel transport system permease protein
MIAYIARRILLFIPTLIVISLLTFGLSKIAPGDPVELLLRDQAPGQGIMRGDLADADRVYEETAEFLGLNKPVFYFGLSTAAYPDTLHRVLRRDRRETLGKLVSRYGNWEYISAYYAQIQVLEKASFALQDSLAGDGLSVVRSRLRRLYLIYREEALSSNLDTIENALRRDERLQAALGNQFQTLRRYDNAVREQATPWKNYLPALQWYGFDNQYHRWISGFVSGRFGISYKDSRPVAHKVKDALRWTLIMNGCALLIAYLLSIPLGVYSAVHKDTLFDRVTTIALFILYSLPTFWIATILVVFFSTPEYGMDWFPSMGLGNLHSSAPFRDRFWETALHLILPVFCLTYGALAFISRQMRGGVLNVIRQDYIRTARAKGLGARKVIWKHAFRNALFPIITLFASVFPAALAGSVIIEVIFNIPGMGKLTVDSIFARDWPVVYAILMLSAILTMAGILLADIMYAAADPRVTFTAKKT